MTKKLPTSLLSSKMVTVLVAIAIIVSAVGFVATGFGAITTGTTASTAADGTPTLTQTCSEPMWNSTTSNNQGSSIPVFLMNPGSSAVVCVTYQSSLQQNATQFPATGMYQFGLSISKEHCVTSGANTGCTATISHSFTTSASPSSIQLSPNTNYVTVVYTINSLSNSTGFYDNAIPNGNCDNLPIAVGYTASQVNASDFSQPRISASCPVPTFDWISTSVSGMNVTSIVF